MDENPNHLNYWLWKEILFRSKTQKSDNWNKYEWQHFETCIYLKVFLPLDSISRFLFLIVKDKKINFVWQRFLMKHSFLSQHYGISATDFTFVRVCNQLLCLWYFCCCKNQSIDYRFKERKTFQVLPIVKREKSNA